MEQPTERFLTDQTAIVTGSSSGLGAACAIELARRGANVVVNYLGNATDAEEVAHKCSNFGVNALVVQADVSQEGDVEKLFTETKKAFSTLDILVTNAGIQRDAAFVDMTLEQWQRVIDVNLTGYFLCSQKAAHRFLEQGVREGVSRAAGKIIHMSSVHDVIPWAGHVNYAASKGGVMLFMKSLAQELASKRIRVNAISPGAIKTPINQSVWSDPEQMKALLTLMPYGRIGEPEDVANCAAWLASDYSDYVTGTTIYVDGGMTLYPGFEDNG